MFERQPEKASDLPTWAIDWSQPLAESPLQKHWIHISSKLTAFDFVGGKENGILKFNGLRLGVFTQILSLSRTTKESLRTLFLDVPPSVLHDIGHT